MKKCIFCITSIALFFRMVIPVSAHVTVKPKQVGVGERTDFVVSVPTEEDNPTVAVRLIVPEGVTSVRPNVKPGWTIQLKRNASENVTEITWSGGSIPAEQRDEFIFSAQVPTQESTLNWKAYQTYQTGDVVAWDNDHAAPKPYSQTSVVNDLEEKASINENIAISLARDTKAIILSLIAVTLSICALTMQVRAKKK